MSTKIQWTDETWNPVTGCTKVSAGCKHCYAERIAERFWKRTEIYDGEGKEFIDGAMQDVTYFRPRKFTDVMCHPERLDIPLHWKKPRRVFVNSMSDLFHEDVPDEFISEVFGVMFETPQHSYQILTKRPEKMQWLLGQQWGAHLTLPNVWLGVSAEDQDTADDRINYLLQTPAAVRFVSLEPLLGPIDLNTYLCPVCAAENDEPMLDWVIVGGESGPDFRAFPMEWMIDIVKQCDEAGVPVFVKQDCGRKPGQQVRIPDYIWNRKEYPKEVQNDIRTCKDQ